MKHKAIFTAILVIVMAMGMVQPAWAKDNTNTDLAQVRAVTAAYHNTSIANAAGYKLVNGLDYCFDNPGVGGMGYHLINMSLFDTVLDPLKPEALVYAPDSSGRLHLAAVEYIVLISAWDAAYPGQWPTLFGQSFQKDIPLGVYSLHAWIWRPNPTGVFSEWNPQVSCNS
jgi:hypothetical protein